MTTRTFVRAPAAFSSLDELLNWSERTGPAMPAVYAGPDRSIRGSVEIDQPVSELEELDRNRR